MFKYVLTVPKRIVLAIQALFVLPFAFLYVIFSEDCIGISNTSWVLVKGLER